MCRSDLKDLEKFLLKKRFFGTNFFKNDSFLLNEKKKFSTNFPKKLSFFTERSILLNKGFY